ncbi:UNVERIFIED_CONTAM: hypothetical protein PYX00_010946 [Menopon gallinae]|uniref:Bromo domain-containing protein n=1 Tax=Menopon gallinae TaxID=328185 RepID=A0AAW2H6N6_9NEOP
MELRGLLEQKGEGASAAGRGTTAPEIFFPEKGYEYRLKRPRFRRKQAEMLVQDLDESIRARSMSGYREESRSLSEMFGGSKSLAIKRLFKKREYEQGPGAGRTCLAPVDVVDWERDALEGECVRAMCDVRTRELVNSIFEEEGWEGQIVYDESCMSRFKPFLTLWLNDPNLIFDVRDDRRKGKRRPREAGRVEGHARSRYNISNDKYYSFEVTAKSNLGTHGVQHSVPALKLHPDLYKTNFTNEELRAFHRPPLRLRAGVYRFAALKDAEFKTSSIIKKTSELTLSTESDFLLVEYSEEHPPLVQNAGMVSLIGSFFRKGSQLEEPAADRYQTTVLEPEDPSPFFGYGDVQPGEAVLAMTNNLFKAPLFRHASNDLLCVRSGESLYMRRIEEVLLAGQTLPSDVVYSPNSRRYNMFCKNRLRNTVYRLLNASREQAGVSFSVVDGLFTHFSEGSKRKWLKEFAEVAKRGRENFWVLRPGEAILSEEDLRKLVTPENVCQYESMLAAERLLLDMGYEVSERFEDEGLLELEGAGDPTGVGEGFSFVKMKFKKGSETEDRRLLNEAQARYKGTVQKIWARQAESLSSSRDIAYEEVAGRFDAKEAAGMDAVPENKVRPHITIRRVFVVDGERIVEEEDVYDKRVIDGYLRARSQPKAEDKKSLRCGSCGQAGHMKTNRVCPRFSETKVTKKARESMRKRARSTLVEMQLSLVGRFFAIPYSAAFHRPVSAKKFPDYRSFVSSPIDLSTIRSRAKAFRYRVFRDLVRDLELLRDNCKTYNGENHSLTKIAQSMVDMACETHAKNREEIEQAERACEEEAPSDSAPSLQG